MTQGGSREEWWFYHLERTGLEAALGPLLEKCLEKGWRVLVVADEQRLPDLDAGLWTWRDDSFTPHGLADQHAGRHPILISADSEPLNGAQAVVLLDGASADASRFARCMVMFDGADTATRDIARSQYKAAKDGGAVVRYFQQDGRGGWVEKT